MNITDGERFFCSWSGGKDSCLALYKALRGGGVPVALMTMLDESGEVSRGHRIPSRLIEKQAESLGIPLAVRATDWDGYRSAFLSVAGGFRKDGAEAGVFGDIELEEHRVWLEETCSLAGVKACLPLWNISRSELGRELLEAGFKAMIVTVREERLDRCYLGRVLDDALLAEFEDLGIDSFGEDGEYHTLIVDGPIFSSPLEVGSGGRYREDDHWHLELTSG